jgi:predicted phosphodiesterase
MLRALILVILFVLAQPSELFAEKILCISDYQGSGKATTLALLLDTILAKEGQIDTVIVAGDYIEADDVLTSIWTRFGNLPKTHPPEVLLARGDHDGAAARVLDCAYPRPSNSRISPIHLPEQKPGQIRAYAHNGMLFIVTDPFLSLKREGYTKRQLDRIEALLSTSKYTHAFVIGHMPAFPKFRHIGKSIDHFTYARDRLVRILARSGALFIYGHDHYANMMRIDASLHIDCGTVNGQYGSVAIIDTGSGTIAVRYYEVFMQGQRGFPTLAFQSGKADTSTEPCTSDQKTPLNPKRYNPIHLWGSMRVPPSRQQYIEMGLMESNLEYLLDWINYFL